MSHFDSQTVMKRSLSGNAWADDAAILARVLEMVLKDFKQVVGKVINSKDIEVNLDTAFKQAVSDLIEYRKQEH